MIAHSLHHMKCLVVEDYKQGWLTWGVKHHEDGPLLFFQQFPEILQAKQDKVSESNTGLSGYNF